MLVDSYSKGWCVWYISLVHYWLTWIPCACHCFTTENWIIIMLLALHRTQVMHQISLIQFLISHCWSSFPSRFDRAKPSVLLDSSASENLKIVHGSTNLVLQFSNPPDSFNHATPTTSHQPFTSTYLIAEMGRPGGKDLHHEDVTHSLLCMGCFFSAQQILCVCSPACPRCDT